MSLLQNRCFLQISTIRGVEATNDIPFSLSAERVIGSYIRKLIHLPGLRGNPERTYPITAVKSEFPGTFENYVASVIGQWQVDDARDTLKKVNRDLKLLSLASKVTAKSIDDTQVELHVSRLLSCG